MDPRSPRFILKGLLLLAAASSFNAIQHVLCMGLIPIKYSTHAQLLQFVRCTYAVRLIVASLKKKKKKKQFVRCSTSDGSGTSRNPFSRSRPRFVAPEYMPTSKTTSSREEERIESFSNRAIDIQISVFWILQFTFVQPGCYDFRRTGAVFSHQ